MSRRIAILPLNSTLPAYLLACVVSKYRCVFDLVIKLREISIPLLELFYSPDRQGLAVEDKHTHTHTSFVLRSCFTQLLLAVVRNREHDDHVVVKPGRRQGLAQQQYTKFYSSHFIITLRNCAYQTKEE